MNFDKLFKILSYSAVLCGFSSLLISGAVGPIGTFLFIAIFFAAWRMEGSKWRISERIGTALIVLSIPAFYLGWRFQIFGFSESGPMMAAILARLILTLSAIKLLQQKSDRDWIFLYLMSFFEVLLAAGLSISAAYLAAFIIYLFVMICTIILFEIRKSNRLLSASKDTIAEATAVFPVRRLPFAGFVLIMAIVLMAVPMFFMLPRVGGAGIGGNSGGVSTMSGFSDTVRLGGIGTIQQNDQVVMRVRVEGPNDGTSNLHWRGIALDTFNDRTWSKSKPLSKDVKTRGERDMIQVDYASGRDRLTLQTVYLEPLDTPVLFSLSRAVGVQGNFPALYVDTLGAITYPPSGQRLSYKVLSDRELPSTRELRADNAAYPIEKANYLQLPDELDPRIGALAKQVAATTRNRFDAALAIEAYLQNSFEYTLEQRASGDQPLADFLFNVKAGHCEYFATAMAIMLRTQGIATRIVNGFQQGEYNETADVFVVRQRNAHSWVEVYFPKEDAWVPFDPTPAAGQNLLPSGAGLTAKLKKYIEALETFWVQYFVAYDNQEQRSLFTVMKRRLSEYRNRSVGWLDASRELAADWWRKVRGDEGLATSALAVMYSLLALAAIGLAAFVTIWIFKKLVRLSFWGRLGRWLHRRDGPDVIEFYERMQAHLANKGLYRKPHQTPLEFAFAVGMPEAVKVTEKYNSVRFGEKHLSYAEANEIEEWLERLRDE